MKILLFVIALFGLTSIATSQSREVQLKLVNIDDIEKNKEKGHPIIHMTANQWKEFIKDAENEKYDSATMADSYSLKVVPLGNDPVEFGVLLFAVPVPCNPGCKESNFGRCYCDLPGTVTLCAISGGRGNWHCGGICTSGRKCKMFLSQGDWGLILVGCRCK